MESLGSWSKMAGGVPARNDAARRRIRGRARHEGIHESKGERYGHPEGDFRFRDALRFPSLRCRVFPICVLAHRTWRLATSHCAPGERGAATPPPPLFPSKPPPGRPRATPSAVATMRLCYHPRRVLSPAYPRGGVVPPPTVT